MAQVVDLGVQSFKKNHSGQCLLSRATATLVFEDNIKHRELTANRSVNLYDTWVTLKRELAVDLHIEMYSNPTTTMSNLVKQAVETVQSSSVS